MHRTRFLLTRSIVGSALAMALIISLACLAPVAASAETHVRGTISADTTWTPEGSPYVMQEIDDYGPVEVGPDATLTVLPGTRIRRGNRETGISVLGRLVARGTANSPIGFDGVSIGPGGSGPRLIDLEHVRFRSCSPSLVWNGTRLTNSVLIGTSRSLKLDSHISGITNNVFVRMAILVNGGGVVRDNVFYLSGLAPYESIPVVVTGNDFLGSQLFQPASGRALMDATGNWWGTSDTSTVEASVVDGDHDQVVYAPFLTAPSPTAPHFESVAPTSWLSGVPSGWVSHDVALTLTASDNEGGSGIYDSYLTISTDALRVQSAVPVILTEEGSQPIQYWSEDFFGNEERPRKTTLVQIDKTAPFTASDVATSYTGSALIHLTASDGVLSGLARTEWNLDASGWTSGTVVSVSTSGDHSLQFRSIDIAGNVEGTRAVEFQVLIQSEVVVSSPRTVSLGYASDLAVSGTLKGDGLGLPGRRVILQSAAPGGSFKDAPRTATTSLGGSFTLSVRPTAKTYYRVRFAGLGDYAASRSVSVRAVPAAWVRTPAAPSRMSKSKYRAVSGYLKPRHAAGTHPVRIYRWKRTSSGSWKRHGYVKAKASNYSDYTKYSARVKLTAKGRWRLRAYAPADSGHAATWSSKYDYVTVK